MRYLNIIQIITAVFLILFILLQSRGSGLSGVFGGGGEIYRTKRGLEKTLFTLTIIFSVVFFSLAIVNVIL